MYDGDSLSEASQLQRAVGELRVAVRRFGPETVLRDLRQVGCLKARFPRPIVSDWMDIVMLNIGGGVAGGDRLDVAIEVEVGAKATVTAQAAERFYRALAADKPSRVRNQLTVGAGASLEWLPQETILFDHCALDRRLEVDLAHDAYFLGVETTVFGRTAMGERVRQGWLRDLIRLRRKDELLLHDATRLDGEIHAALQRPAVGGGACVVGTMIYVAPDAGEKLDAVRRGFGAAEAGASVWNGMLLARILGLDSASVRRTMVVALEVLRKPRPLPRVWLC